MNKKLMKAILAVATSVMIVAPQVAGAVEVVSANTSTVSTKALAMVERSISISRADVHKHTNKASAVKVQGVGLTIYAYFQSDDGKEVTLFAEKPDGDNYVKRFAKSGTTNINFDDGKTAIHRVKVNISGQIPQPIEQSYVTVNDVIKENASDKGVLVGKREFLYDNGSTQVIKPSGNVYAGYKLQGGNQTIKVNGDMTVTFVYMKESNTGGYVPLNLDTLRSTLASVDKLKIEEYTSSSWNALETARQASYNTLVAGVTQNDKESGNMTQAQINTVNTNLQNAIKNLVKVTAPVRLNVEALQASVTKFEKLNEALYTPASWKTFSTARNNANKVLKNNNATQAQVNKANADLVKAQKSLKKEAVKVNKNTLKATVTKANKVKAKGYTKASFNSFAKVRTASTKVLKNAKATQAQVNKANTDLVKAQKSLKKVAVKVNKNTLKATVTKANKVNAKGYTKASFNKFAKVRKASTKVLNNAKATQAQVNKANKDLNQGMTALKKV